MGGTDQHVLQTHFGAFLKMRRDQWGVRQREILFHLQGWTQTNYSRLESGTIAPAFDQLLPIYKACLQAGVHWDASDRQHFLTLARTRIDHKKNHLDHHSDSEWAELRYQMTNVDFFPDEPTELSDRWTPPRPLLAETSHLIGREDWHAALFAAMKNSPGKKLLILQGPVGIGKSSELHRLIQHFIHASNPAYHVIWIPLLPAERSAGPESCLNLVLGNILAESGTPPLPPEMASWEKRQRLALAQLEHSDRPVVILIDNAESILTEEGMLSTCWEEFLSRFLGHQHQAILVLATKEWTGWPGRDRLFVHETTVPPLNLASSVSLLQHLGLASVPLQHLQEACNRVGGIPLCLEWIAALVQDPLSLDDWHNFDGTSTPEHHSEAELTDRLIRLVAEPTLLRGHFAAKLQPLLTRILEKRLSPEAKTLLQHLAVCNVPLGKTALQTVCEHPGVIRELRNASLLVAYSHRVQVLPMVADVVVEGLKAEQVSELEENVIHAFKDWVDKGTIEYREAGNIITEFAILLLKHHRLLEAAELLIQYGWLSINQDYIPRLAQLVTHILRQSDWHNTENNECGGLFLRAFLGRYLSLQTSDIEKTFQRIHELVHLGNVELRPRTIIYLIHNKLRFLIAKDQYTEAWILINEEYNHYKYFQEADLITFTELLDRQAYVLGRWGDTQNSRGEQEDALRLRQACVEVHLQCIALLSQCETVASPLQRIYILFKRARFLNDVACYQRRVGHLEEAKQAMKECLEIKEKGFTLPDSLAVSYGDYGQLLGELGCFQDALLYSTRALFIIQKLIDIGLTSPLEEKGMQLIDRGKLLMLLGRLNDAKACFEEGVPLVEGTSRRVSATIARKELQLIEERYKINSHYYLDWRWFSRYHELASYSEVRWLTQAGPFSEEEQQEWNSLFHQRDDENFSKRLSTIIATSRRRELELSLQEQREPSFHYPLIPYDEVQSRIAGFSQLRAEIERDEPNAIVRRLYLSAIDELLDELHLITATSRQDDKAFWVYNQRVNYTPSFSEMEIAITQLENLLQRGLSRDDTHDLAKQIAQQMRHWNIELKSLRPSNTGQEVSNSQEKLSSSVDKDPKLFSPETVHQFFADVFRKYEFDWTIAHDPAADFARVNLNYKQLILPTNKWVSSEAIRELLGHEIEMHVFRASAGEKSPLALLSTGLGGYLETEEGLALYYTQEIAWHHPGGKPNKSWIGTLATGLATGIVCEPFTFRKLLLFLESVNTLRSLLTGKKANLSEIREEARRSAQSRCLRTWRGVTNLTHAGVCSTKDNVYLRGYIAVSQALEKDKTTFERLMVGSTGLQHLADLEELGIVAPPVEHLRLATDPALDTYIEQFAD